jgi:hypothetical protein
MMSYLLYILTQVRCVAFIASETEADILFPYYERNISVKFNCFSSEYVWSGDNGSAIC